MADEYNWDEWDKQANEYLDWRNAGGQMVPTDTGQYYINPDSSTTNVLWDQNYQTDPVALWGGPTAEDQRYLIPFGEPAAGSSSSGGALSQQERLWKLLADKEERASQPKELAPWQQFIKDNQGSLALGLGALGLYEKLTSGKATANAMKTAAKQAEQAMATNDARSAAQNQAYDYEIYQRPVRAMTAEQLGGLKRYGRSGSAPIAFFNPSGVLAGQVTGTRSPSAAAVNPLYQPTPTMLLAKGGLAALKDKQHPESAANFNREAQKGIDQFIQWLMERSQQVQSNRRNEEEPVSVEIEVEEERPEERAKGGYMRGGTGGQADKIPAMLSDGEYVFDAESVAALGDGNNAAGAAKLDNMRQNIRAHKRNAPTNKIAPKAKQPEAYLKGKK